MAELSFPDPPLTDGVVSLRLWRREDIPFVVAACQDPEVARYSPVIPYPYVEADAVGWFGMHEPTRLAGDGIDFAVVDADTDAPLGAISINQMRRILKSAEVGYWLALESRGYGYTSRALRLLAKWTFEGLGLARLELTNDPENIASQRVAERCGFQREGLLRSHLLIRHSGERRDSLVWGLLPGELITT